MSITPSITPSGGAARNAAQAAERRLGREPYEQAFNNKGFDILSIEPDGHAVTIEVKGRIEGSDTFTITTNEITFAQTQLAHSTLVGMPLRREIAHLDRAALPRPLLPWSLPVMAAIALVPPLWRRVMDRRVARMQALPPAP